MMCPCFQFDIDWTINEIIHMIFKDDKLKQLSKLECEDGIVSIKLIGYKDVWFNCSIAPCRWYAYILSETHEQTMRDPILIWKFFLSIHGCFRLNSNRGTNNKANQ